MLKMTQACVRKRLESRHGGGEGKNEIIKSLERMHSLYEDVGEDESQTYTVTVDENTTKDDVIDQVLEIMKKHQV